MREAAHLTVSAFTADVAAGSPVPAGGSASALAGSLAAALVTMVCRVSLGREGVVAKDEELRKTLEQSEQLRCRLLELVTEDALAFEALTELAAMPGDDDDQRAARGEALRRATQRATSPALETLTAAREALALAASLTGRVTPEAASDLGVAVHLARAAAEGAMLTAAANLTALPPGDDVDSSFRKIHADIETARASAASVTATITACLRP
jgi:formiminotetrahydrofolate cyclodeaminase